MASFLYDSFKRDIMKGAIDLDDGTQWICLLKNTYTTQAATTTGGRTHTAYSDISTYEVTGGGTTGYTAGGTSCGTAGGTWNVVSADTTNDLGYWDAAYDPTWPSSYITARYAVVYKSVATSAALSLIIACYDFTSDQTSTNGTFTVQWSTAGLIKLS